MRYNKGLKLFSSFAALLCSGVLLNSCIAPAPVKTSATTAQPNTAEKVEPSINSTVHYSGPKQAEATKPPFLFPNPGPFKLIEKDGVEYWQARGEVGKFGGSLKLGSFGGGPKTFNAWDASDVESHGIGMLQFDSLVDFDPWTGKAIPKLAKSYKVSADGRTIDFVMRKGLKWSDGHPLTVDDVVFTYATLIGEGFGETSSRDTISTPGDYPKVVKVDEDTVSFRFKKPFSPFLANLNATMVAPKHIIEPITKR